MKHDHFRYDRRTQEALLGVVRDILTEVSETGLPGNHHFYITFDVTHGGVSMSDVMRKQYPEEMTVVLQNQFWDLATSQLSFEVSLTFSGVPEKLVIPFSAIKRFLDPSVNFGLQFEEMQAEEEQEPENASFPEVDLRADLAKLAAEPPPKPEKARKKEDKEKKAEKEEPSSDGAEVVKLDAFRKKN